LKFFLVLSLSSLLTATDAAMAVGTPTPYKCQKAISELSIDFKGLSISKEDTEQIFTILFEARRLCALGYEDPALKKINQARAMAGLDATTGGEFDWENTPLEELEDQ